jgi:WD40 repeat protein
MIQSSRNFRIFVSSTFSDLKAERNALQEKVFPRLRDLAAAHGCRFQAIDLRWGVSDEAALDQQTMKICLDEIERCQKTSPRPNFVVLLGDRYGWRPLPSEIPADDFSRILTQVPDGDRSLLEWYQRDDNAVPAVYCLQPRSGEFVEYEAWEQVEKDLRQILVSAIDRLDFSPEARLKYTASATEQEIVAGALKVPDASQHVFCFMRGIQGLPEDDSAAGYRETAPEAARKQSELKMRLKEQLPGNAHEYTAQWQGNGPGLDHLDQMCEDVYAELSAVMLAEAGLVEANEPLEREVAAHAAFGAERSRVFIGRADTLKAIENYTSAPSPHPLTIWGASGSGKSALMAKAIEQAQKNGLDVLYRFIGATSDSSNGRALLESLCRQVSRRYGADETGLPSEYRDLVKEFPRRLALAKPEKALVLFLDALDQLSETDHARSLVWLPAELPPNVSIVVSTLPGECLQALETKLPAQARLELKPMSVGDGEAALDRWLAEADRKLQTDQKEYLLGKFKQCGLPLYLKLAFEEARLWKSYSGLPGLGGDIPGMLRDLFTRLSQESNHGAMLVSRSLGYLAAGRNGLSEDEMLDVLSRDAEVLADFQRRSPKSPKVDHLPVVVWSRIFFDLEPYLSERKADGASLLAFYHRQLREAVEQFCNDANLFPRLHAGLADYFGDEARPFWIDSRKAEPDRRKTSEIAFQQAMAHRGAKLEFLLTHFDFLQARLAAAGPEELITDYDLAIRPSVIQSWAWEEEQLAGLTLVRDGLRLSASALAQDHQGLLIQLWGRLAGNALAGIQRLLEGSKASQAGPWLRPVFPCFTPPGGAEVRTLAGHQASVSAVAISPDGRLIVSGSADKSLKIWELESGVERMTLTGHSSYVTSVAISADGRWIISGSDDKSLKRWDLATGSEQLTYNSHTAAVTAVAITPDGREVVSASKDTTLKVWDLETGSVRLTLAGHKKEVSTIAITPDGKRIVSASRDWTHKTWDLKTGRELNTRPGHGPVAVMPDGKRVFSGSKDRVTHFGMWDLDGKSEDIQFEGYHGSMAAGIAITPDGRSALTASGDHSLKTWDIENRCEKYSFWHSSFVTAVAISPDGEHAVSASADKTLKLWNLKLGDKPARLPGHEYSFGEINALAVTGDGRWAVSASGDRTLKVWDVQTGLERSAFTGHTETVQTVALTPDGQMAISASGPGSNEVIAWNLETGKQHIKLGSHADNVGTVAVTPDGRLAVSASLDNTLKVWNLKTGRIQFTLSGHTGNEGSRGVYALAITPNGELALSGAMDHTVKVWDLKTGAERSTFEHKECVYAIANTPDGRLAISSEGSGSLRVWDLETGLQRYQLSGHKNFVRVVAVTPDGNRAVSVSRDQTVKVWDLDTGKETRTLLGHTAAVYSLAISPDGRLALTGSEDRTLRVWDLQDGSCVACFTGLSSFESDIRIVVDPFRIIVGDKGGHIYFLALENWSPGSPLVTAWQHNDLTGFPCPYCNAWSQIDAAALGSEITCTHCGRQSRLNLSSITGAWQADIQPDAQVSSKDLTFIGHSLSAGAVAITPDGRRALSGAWDKTVKVWERGNAVERCTLTGHLAHVNGVAITSDGQLAISGSSDKTLKVWDLKSGTEKFTLAGHSDRVNGVAITPDGSLAVSGSHDCTLRVWDVRTGVEKFKLTGHSAQIHGVAISADGRMAISCSGDRTLRTWDLHTGQAGFSLHLGDDKGWAEAVAITPDGRLAVSGSVDHLVRVWDLGSRCEIFTMKGHTGGARSVAISADGRLALSGSIDKTLKVWDLTTGAEKATLNGHKSEIFGVAMTPDGRMAISCSLDGVIKIWDLDRLTEAGA